MSARESGATSCAADPELSRGHKLRDDPQDQIRLFPMRNVADALQHLRRRAAAGECADALGVTQEPNSS